jgi:hypothetical protein
MWMNRVSVCMASNEDWCVPAGLDERRFAVFDVSPAKIQDVSYFAAIHAELRAGGYQAMLHDLLALPLGDWHPRQHVPKTEALVENQLDGLRGCDRVVHQILDTAVVEGGWSHFETALPHVSGSVFIPTSVVAGGDMRRLVSAARALSRCIRTEGGSRALSSLATVKNGFESMRTRGFVLPPLPEARANWAEASRLKVSWNEIPEWTAVPPKRF